MAITQNVIENSVEEIIDTLPSINRNRKNIAKNNFTSKTTSKKLGSLSKSYSLRHPVDENLKLGKIESCRRPFMSNPRLIRSATRRYPPRSFTHQSKANIIWCGFVSIIIASIFGQLSNVVLATNDVLSTGGLDLMSQDNNVYDDYPDHINDDTTPEIDGYGLGGETICFYNESDDDDITCLPELGDAEKRASYLFRSKKGGNYLFRSRRAPSYLFRSKKAPSYLFRSRRSSNEMLRDRKAQGYLFRSRRAPSYLFRSKKAPSYLFRSKKAPSYLFRSKKPDGKQSRSYFFRSRKAGNYLFRSRRDKGYLFRSRREEQTGDNVRNDKNPSIATRAGYLFRTRKSYPSEWRDELEKNMDGNTNPLNRQLRSRSYLFRSKKSSSDPMDDSNINVATRGAYLFRT